eukprot:GHRR01005466.1.p1 GENE.GHRR01005466.1~~GHRR01005466.1.p1  ORF type:complete len:268 (+),score=79.40 GHRR01005466.1:76-879(+)
MRAFGNCTSNSRLGRGSSVRAQPHAVPAVRRNPSVRAHRLQVIATSEFWWEDELEYDALTEVLLPKRVYLATPSSCEQHLQQLKDSTEFAAAFTAPDLQESVEQLWQQLGRAGPPLFLKVRTRRSLQPDAQGSIRQTAASDFWQELTSQTWRTELDYGLVSGKEATAESTAEQILVIADSQECVDSLVAAAIDSDSPGSSDSSGGCDYGSSSSSPSTNMQDADVVVVQFQGWNEGQTQKKLSSWQQLAPTSERLTAMSQPTAREQLK